MPAPNSSQGGGPPPPLQDRGQQRTDRLQPQNDIQKVQAWFVPVDDGHTLRYQTSFAPLNADGTPYKELGTTCYNWVNQSAARRKQTLNTFKDSPFNKVRMSILPMQYDAPPTQPSTIRRSVPECPPDSHSAGTCGKRAL